MGYYTDEVSMIPEALVNLYTLLVSQVCGSTWSWWTLHFSQRRVHSYEITVS